MLNRYLLGALIAITVACLVVSPATAELRFVTHGKSNRIIVFIDGLQADSTKAFRWGQGVGSWPELMAGDTSPEDQQLPLANYDTAILSFAGVPADHASVPQLASRALSELKGKGVMEAYDSIAFVAYGAGGLVLKSILVQSATSGSAALIRKSKIVFLLSVPAQGRPAADLITVLAEHEGLAVNFGALNVGMFLQGLESLWSEYLSRRGPTRRLEVYCRHETTPTYGVAVAAGQYTTDGCDDNTEDPSADHQSIARPPSREAGVYRWVRTHLADYFKRFPTDPGMPKSVQAASADGTTVALAANAAPIKPPEAVTPAAPAAEQPSPAPVPPVALADNPMTPAPTPPAVTIAPVETQPENSSPARMQPHAEPHRGHGSAYSGFEPPALRPARSGDWSFALRGRDCNLTQYLWVVKVQDRRLKSESWNAKIGTDGGFAINNSAFCTTEIVRGRVAGNLGQGTYLYADPCHAIYCRVRFHMTWRVPVEALR